MKRLTIIMLMFAFAFCSVMAKNNNLADKLTVNNNSIDITKQDIELPDVAVGYLTDPEGNMIALDCIDPKTATTHRFLMHRFSIYQSPQSHSRKQCE